MDVAQHADACMKEFGEPFHEVHNFLDQYYREYGLAHWSLLHHRLGVELIVERFGEKARAPAELHIRQDTGGELPEDWSFYGEPLLIQIEDYDKMDAELRKLYGDKVFEKVEAIIRQMVYDK